jgi:hypothetical protein
MLTNAELNQRVGILNIGPVNCSSCQCMLTNAELNQRVGILNIGPVNCSSCLTDAMDRVISRRSQLGYLFDINEQCHVLRWLWLGRVLIKSGLLSATCSSPLIPQEQRESGHSGTSHSCQEATYAVQQITAYSITSSAMASSLSGTSRPSALAVLRFMTSSNLVGCRTGRSPGLSPLRMRPTYVPACR